MHWVCPHPLKHEEHTPAVAEEMQKTKAGPVQGQSGNIKKINRAAKLSSVSNF